MGMEFPGSSAGATVHYSGLAKGVLRTTAEISGDSFGGVERLSSGGWLFDFECTSGDGVEPIRGFGGVDVQRVRGGRIALFGLRICTT